MTHDTDLTFETTPDPTPDELREAELTAFTLNELDADRRAAVEARLADDPELREQAAERRRDADAMRAAFAAEPLPAAAPAPAPRSMWVRRGVGLAACLGLAAGASTLFLPASNRADRGALARLQAEAIAMNAKAGDPEREGVVRDRFASGLPAAEQSVRANPAAPVPATPPANRAPNPYFRGASENTEGQGQAERRGLDGIRNGNFFDPEHVVMPDQLGRQPGSDASPAPSARPLAVSTDEKAKNVRFRRENLAQQSIALQTTNGRHLPGAGEAEPLDELGLQSLNDFAFVAD